MMVNIIHIHIKDAEMEKYIRLLGAKTVNYEAIRVDNASGSGGITAQDVLLAMSYAKLSPVQDNLIRLKCFGANSLQNINKFSPYLIQRYESRISNDAQNHILSSINVALIEFCAVAGDYKPSVRNRALIAGVHYLIVHRYLGKAIDLILEDFNEQFSLASEKVLFQINQTN